MSCRQRMKCRSLDLLASPQHKVRCVVEYVHLCVSVALCLYLTEFPSATLHSVLCQPSALRLLVSVMGPLVMHCAGAASKLRTAADERQMQREKEADTADRDDADDTVASSGTAAAAVSLVRGYVSLCAALCHCH